METNMNPDVHQELHDKGKDRRVFLVQRGYFDGQNLGLFSTEGNADVSQDDLAATKTAHPPPLGILSEFLIVPII